MGGGFGMYAPWPAGKLLIVGGRCGNFFKQGAHRDWGGQWHDDRFAIDIGLCSGKAFGTPLLAAIDGTVRVATRDPDYGNTVVIEASPGGTAIRYAHLDKITVKPGAAVTAGQEIGILGHSGAGPKNNSHLHFVVYSGRRHHAGVPPPPMAGDRICNDCLIKSLTKTQPTGLAPFLATLLSRSPQDANDQVHAAPGQTIPFDFHVRFNEPFDPFHFVLRPVTSEVAHFSDHPGDFFGSATESDRTAGVYSGLLQVPPDTPAGTYRLGWEAIRTDTGQLGNLSPQLILVVSRPPPPPPPSPGPPLAGGAHDTSFEHEAGNPNWATLNGGTQQNDVCGDGTAHDGSCFYDVSASAAPNNSFYQDFPFSPPVGQCIALSSWFRSRSAATFSGTLAIWFRNGQSDQSASTPFTAGQQWTHVLVVGRVPAPPSGPAWSRLRGQLYINSANQLIDWDLAQWYGPYSC